MQICEACPLFVWTAVSALAGWLPLSKLVSSCLPTCWTWKKRNIQREFFFFLRASWKSDLYNTQVFDSYSQVARRIRKVGSCPVQWGMKLDETRLQTASYSLHRSWKKLFQSLAQRCPAYVSLCSSSVYSRVTAFEADGGYSKWSCLGILDEVSLRLYLQFCLVSLLFRKESGS